MDGRISPSLLDAIRDRVTLSEFVGKHVALKRHGRESTGLCPFHQERTPSFSVNDQKGIFHCFGGCGAHGDVIDFAQRVYRLSFREAVDALARDNGLGGAAAHIDPVALKRTEERRLKVETERMKYLAAALRIWNEALPAENSPVERYLRSRAITGPIPTSLRYHPEMRYRISDKTWIALPAMIGSVTNSNGQMLSVHRTFIKRDGSGKADVPKPKLMLGDARGGGIYLFAGLGLKDGTVFELDTLNVTEGVETGLSLQLMSGIPTIAAASTGGMIALNLPALPQVKQVIIGADNDANGSGVRAATQAAQRWTAEGREVRIEKPCEAKDYNDVLRLLADRPTALRSAEANAKPKWS